MTTTKPGGLTRVQETFCREYLLDLNATRAYQAAYPGVKKTSASANGSRLLANAKVAARVQTLIQERSQRIGITGDWVLQQLKTNVERAMQEVPVFVDGKPTGVFQYEGAVANGALKLLGEHLGLFTKKVEHGGHVGGGVLMVPGPITETEWAGAVAEQRRKLHLVNGDGAASPARPRAEVTR